MTLIALEEEEEEGVMMMDEVHQVASKREELSVMTGETPDLQRLHLVVAGAHLLPMQDTQRDRRPQGEMPRLPQEMTGVLMTGQGKREDLVEGL